MIWTRTWWASLPKPCELLRDYPWPGNVREVQNVIRQAVLQTTGPVLLADFLPDVVRRAGGGVAARVRRIRERTRLRLDQLIDDRLRAGSHQLYDEIVGRVEGELIEHALRLHRRGQAGGDQVAGSQSGHVSIHRGARIARSRRRPMRRLHSTR